MTTSRPRPAANPMRRFRGCAAAVAVLAPLALPAAARAQTAAVATYHNGNDRAGEYVVPSLTLLTASRMHRDQKFDGRVDGQVYAQPLYWHTSGAAGGEVIVATESNHVTALDAATGAVVWDRTLGAQIGGGALPCGNIIPLGIT